MADEIPLEEAGPDGAARSQEPVRLDARKSEDLRQKFLAQPPAVRAIVLIVAGIFIMALLKQVERLGETSELEHLGLDAEDSW
jgi:hypothetical protein